MRLSKNQKEIIKNIGLGALALGILIAPGLAHVYPLISPKRKYKLKQSIKRLEENGVIYLSGDKVKLTEKGKKILQDIEINEIEIDKPDKWNGVWHLVCYDIPEYKKKQRDYFRLKLKEFGFYVIQDSLWVFPYECKEEIAVIAQSLGVSPFVAYLNTDYLPQQYKLLKYFELNNT